MENSDSVREFGTIFRRCRTGLLVTTILIVMLGVSAANCASKVEGMSSNQLCFSAGYFVNVHSNFYPAFTSGFASNVAFYHDFRNGFGYEIRAGVRLVLEGSPKVNYISLSPAILVTRKLVSTRRIGWRVGAGPGLGIRDYSDTYNGYFSQDRYHQREFSLMAVGETGLDFYMRGLVFRGTVAYDRHLTGDPSRGDFGDTGGLTFLLGFGVRL